MQRHNTIPSRSATSQPGTFSRFNVNLFVPLAIMAICFGFNQLILHEIKIGLWLSSPDAKGNLSGPFQFTGMMGVALVLFIFIFFKLANCLTREKLFYVIITPFLVYLGCFGTLIYPNRAALHMSAETVQIMQATYPSLASIFPLLSNWCFSTFYSITEIWESCIVLVLFWQLANEITKVNESKLYYGLWSTMFGVGALFALWPLGIGTAIQHKLKTAGVLESVAWGDNLFFLTILFSIAGALIIGSHFWLYKKVLKTPPLEKEMHPSHYVPNEQPKLSVTKSIKHIVSSPYIRLIFLILVSSGVSLYLAQTACKEHMRTTLLNEEAYLAFQMPFNFTTGIIVFLASVICSTILYFVSWKTAAMVMPILMLITSVFFFGFVWYSKVCSPETAFLNISLPMVAVYIGALQNFLFRWMHPIFFHITRQMAYIPLGPELKVKGHAIVEIFGKSIGIKFGMLLALIISVIYKGTSIGNLSHIIGPIVIVSALVWLFLVIKLSKRFEALKAQREEAKQSAAA